MTDERVRKIVLPLDWEHLGDAKPLTAAECVGPFALMPWSAYEALREKLIREGFEAARTATPTRDNPFKLRYVNVDAYLAARGEG